MLDRFGDASLADLDRGWLAIGLLAVASGFVVLSIALLLFPHHSSNHDEAVYLQQAAMLLDGQIEVHAGDLADAVRPWFFVQDGGRLYPKYAPVPAGMYAVSMWAVGEPRVTLALVAAGNVALVGVLGTQVFDRRVGVLGAATFAAAPMTLLTSAVFLPYAPTTFLNLIFAVSYLHADRTGSTRTAVVAGCAIGLAFFARPFTAVLFAAPFVVHAGWSSFGEVLRGDAGTIPVTLRRNAVVAACGLAFVALALAYNARLTGSPLTFPFEAFAPLDGVGFGRRRILGHSVSYTPALAVEANLYVLWHFATRWFTAGFLGTAVALGGLAIGLLRWARSVDRDGYVPILAGLFVSVPVGNLLFWGNYNVLGSMADPTDGLIAQFGPIYHFDLLAPLSIFAALSVVTVWTVVRSRLVDSTEGRSFDRFRAVLVAAVLLGLVVAGVANAAALGPPVERNAAFTQKYETAYEPIDDHDFDDGLVFLPTPYGDWLAHPFQRLRNDPELGGDVVYALDRGTDNFEVLSAYPDRDPYRFTYRGEWSATPDERIVPALQKLRITAGERLDGRTTVGIPDRVSHATVRLETAGGVARHEVSNPADSLSIDWSLDPSGAQLHPDAGPGDGSQTVPLADEDRVEVLVRLVQPDGSTLTYREAFTARTTADGVAAIWPPERTVCRLVDRCGTEGTYLPGTEDEYPPGVEIDSTLEPGE